MIELNVTDYDSDELAELSRVIQEELDRRESLESAVAQMDLLQRQYLSASGEVEGGEWVQPTGAHDAYPLGWVVTHDDKTWENITAANVWEPGVSGWREQVSESDDDLIPEWVQPSGAHDAYSQGELVTYEGRVWRSIMDGNVWAPGAYGWVPAE